MAEVIFDHVSKRYGESTVVDDLTMTVEDGEFVVLVGPSGSGKTTALRMIAGLEALSGGRIIIGDRVVNDLEPKDRDIAMVFQSYALYPHMNVFDNMAYGLKLRHLPKDEIDRRVREAASILGMKELLARKPGQLSGGQRQRVALGRAIVREPRVFLMDEPLSNLDAKLRVQTRAELIKLHQRLQRTTIYVTHDQVEAMTMGDRIAVLNAGRLQQFDTPENLYNRPANLFVAGFIGSPSMNFFRMRVESGASDLRLRGARFTLPVLERDAAALEGFAGREIIAGVRPEHILDRRLNGSSPAGAIIRAVVDVIEMLGNEQYVYLSTGDDEPVVARMSAEIHLVRGEPVELVIPPGRLHFFDPKSETAIRGRG
jgi:multiple sugar transport system ATP-binding protein